MRIAMVSEHASPLADVGSVDAGGQNVHVAALAQAMARRSFAMIAPVSAYCENDSICCTVDSKSASSYT